jgi:hypothetical protein
MTEADTCRTYVLPGLYAAGWTDDFEHLPPEELVADIAVKEARIAEALRRGV